MKNECKNHPNVDACNCGDSPMEPKGREIARVITVKPSGKCRCSALCERDAVVSSVWLGEECLETFQNDEYHEEEVSAKALAEKLNAAFEKESDARVKRAESRVWEEAAKIAEECDMRSEAAKSIGYFPEWSAIHKFIANKLRSRSKAASS